MSDDQLPSRGGKSFEDVKKVNEHGAEYRGARDIQLLLGCDQWRDFDGAVKEAKTSCDQSDNDCDHHFAGPSKMVRLGSGSDREIDCGWPGWATTVGRLDPSEASERMREVGPSRTAPSRWNDCKGMDGAVQ